MSRKKKKNKKKNTQKNIQVKSQQLNQNENSILKEEVKIESQVEESSEIVDVAEKTSEQVDVIAMQKIAVYAVMFVMALGSFVGLLVAFRPTMSAIEQRDLTKFPAFSYETVLDGSYFADIALWYADTYPTREQMILVDQKIKSTYGIKTEVAMIGSDIEADEIPDFAYEEKKLEVATEKTNEDETGVVADTLMENVSLDNTVLENVISKNSESPNSESQSSESQNSESQNSADSENSDKECADKESSDEKNVDTEEKSEPVKLPSSTAMEEEIKKNIQQNLYVKNGAAYSKYYFSLNSATKYITALEHAAERLEGKANVINILVPNQSGAMLPYDEMVGLGGSNQIEAIHYYYSQYDKVQTVDTIDTLREHQDEYLYFRTDHHWTADGAYYVYRNFCELKGWKAHELSYFKKLTFDPYLGSFYSQLQDPSMRENPDYVNAYVPRGTNDLVYWDVNGVEHKWQVVTDVSKWNMYSGYCAFVGGDKPLAIIENPAINDNSSCLVIKESYGNCFIPFLVDHYQTVYIMDCRYATENFCDFVEENEINDLIFINNITIIGATGVCNRIAMLVE